MQILNMLLSRSDLLAILIKALINFILFTKFASLHISVTTQNISLFTICEKWKNANIA